MSTEIDEDWEFTIDPAALSDDAVPLDLSDPDEAARFRAELLEELDEASEAHRELQARSWEIARFTFVG